MKINCSNFSFKGYDAMPLKRIYADSSYCDPIYPEMQKICEEENIDFATVYDNNIWFQDNAIIVEKNGKPRLIGNGEISNNFMVSFNHRYGIKGKKVFPFVEGGNTFIGNFPNGNKWMLIGVRDEIINDIIKSDLSKNYNIDPKNIFTIPKPDFHIDLGVRPIGFPNILVNDPDLVRQELDRIDDNSILHKTLKHYFKSNNRYKLSIGYSSCDEICDALKEQGFNPIRVAGVFYGGINFMNAIVNKHDDGKISYITNSSECNNHIYKKVQEDFEKELKEKVPNIDKVYFVHGISKNPYPDSYTNFMINTLRDRHGGIHCMTLEEPYFADVKTQKA